MNPFPHFTQLDAMNCCPTCLRMIAKHYSSSYTLQNLWKRLFVIWKGVSMLGISEAAESIGFRTTEVKLGTVYNKFDKRFIDKINIC